MAGAAVPAGNIDNCKRKLEPVQVEAVCYPPAAPVRVRGMSWNSLPQPARAIAVAASAAVDAAARRDVDDLSAGLLALAAADGAGLVLGMVVRLRL